MPPWARTTAIQSLRSKESEDPLRDLVAIKQLTMEEWEEFLNINAMSENTSQYERTEESEFEKHKVSQDQITHTSPNTPRTDLPDQRESSQNILNYPTADRQIDLSKGER